MAVALVFLAAALASHELTAADVGKCRATGAFRNSSYGFAFRIPKGLHGCPNSPVGMSDHGVLMFLTKTRRDRWIECYAGYNALFLQNEDEAADNDIEAIEEYSAAPGTVEVTERTRGTLGGLASVRVVMRYKSKGTGVRMVRDSIVALRPVIKDYEAPSHLYDVSLTTPESFHSRDRLTLERVLKTWQIGPTDDDSE